MKFESRIRHIEEKIRINGAEFCACAGDSRYPRTEIIYWENGKPATSPDMVNKTLPDSCETCAKPIHKMQIIIDFTDAKIPKPEGAK